MCGRNANIYNNKFSVTLNTFQFTDFNYADFLAAAGKYYKVPFYYNLCFVHYVIHYQQPAKKG